MDAKTVQAVIDVLGARWTSKDTPVSGAPLSPASMSYLGLRYSPQLVDAEQLLVKNTEPQLAALAPPPPRVDWRNNGGNFVTSVKNQSACGACVAFATCATLEARARIASKDPNLDIDLAEAHLFSCGCGECCDTGWLNDKALAHAKRKGICAEADFPYVPGNQPCPDPEPPPILKVTAFAAVSSMETRKRVLSSKGPVSASMEVYDDFRTYGSGIYSHVTGSLIGYHAVCVVGYDDSDGCWIVKNSWDTGWGENGFFRIAYGQCGIDTRFAFYDAGVRLLAPRAGVAARGGTGRKGKKGAGHA
ncbi:C1 family peptidase [uncultured Methylobacterium sp.]|jgi:C1A family cysteine protease|uniref:C1 family peptidase n=1 Tax=uncultured Methylobacterium sp. TaxID=157278 RepID=UPI0026175A9B|nr:C1 family peptidase [uncultured Methylobacterium sp.]